ncbi:MAG: Veg family protein [Peptococcaceae bacterium]|nr:Veg family protein [Peptococcaceae bacterium]
MNRRVVNLSTSKKVSKVQEALSQYIGSDVKLKANSGRRKFIERTGVLEGTYSNLFVVRVEEKSVERKMSFSYADLLTGNVVLVIHRDGKDYRLVVNQN